MNRELVQDAPQSDNTAAPVRPAPTADRLESLLKTVAAIATLCGVGLLPLVFIPGVVAPLGLTKIVWVASFASVAIIAIALHILRSGSLRVPHSYTLLSLWGVAGVSVLSALLTNDRFDSLIGDVMGVQTALFTVLVAVVTTLMAYLTDDKQFVMRFFMALAASTLVLGVYHVLRFVFGADFLSFGVFTGATASPIGGWNDLALFFGLGIILSLVALDQLDLTKWGRALFLSVIGIGLIILMVVNFFATWIVMAGVGLLTVMYAIVKDKMREEVTFTKETTKVSFASLGAAMAVFIVSMVFIVAGSLVSPVVSNLVDISYVEVKPSLGATIDMARQNYQENILFSIGPSKFGDAWQLYKDPSINTTVFWNTTFTSGSGYFTTQFATVGIVAVFAWLAFLGLFVRNSFSALTTKGATDRVWYFILTVSVVAAAYLWIMFFVYNPSVMLVLLAAIFTGIVIGARTTITQQRLTLLRFNASNTAGFLLTGFVMVMIIGTSLLMYGVGRHYTAALMFTKTLASTGDIDVAEIEQSLQTAYNITGSDTFLAEYARYQLLKIEALLNVSEEDITAEQQQQFQTAVADGVTAARTAVQEDPSSLTNRLLLARMYSTLALIGIEGAEAEATATFEQAVSLAPNNAEIPLLRAQLASSLGNYSAAREHIAAAVALKSNYSDALFLLAQIEVQEGNLEEAIRAAESSLALAPRDATRAYQLGILQLSDQRFDAAAGSFARAVSLNRNFANARYYLALTLIELGNLDAAESELTWLAERNPDVPAVAELLGRVQSGEVAEVSLPEEVPLQEQDPVVVEGQTVTTDTEPDTSLVVPVNQVPNTTGTSSDS